MREREKHHFVIPLMYSLVVYTLTRNQTYNRGKWDCVLTTEKSGQDYNEIFNYYKKRRKNFNKCHVPRYSL